MIYSKTLELSDYDILPTSFVNTTYNAFKSICRFEHEHRRWEYGLSIQTLLDNNAKNILEVGGGGSLLVPLAYLSDMKVTEVDPCINQAGVKNYSCAETLEKQAQKLNSDPIRYFQQDFLDFDLDEKFDAVVCTSVIEHIDDHESFFLKLLEYVAPEGVLILTTDFHPTGNTFSEDHRRTYSEESLLKYIDMAKGFTVFGDGYDYKYLGNHVYQYTFASLVLKNG